MKPNPGGILNGEAIIDREQEISATAGICFQVRNFKKMVADQPGLSREGKENHHERRIEFFTNL